MQRQQWPYPDKSGLSFDLPVRRFRRENATWNWHRVSHFNGRVGKVRSIATRDLPHVREHAASAMAAITGPLCLPPAGRAY
ncbi:MAG: hypothetical protein ABJQ70_04410 [Roseobacter sp.]